MRRLTTIGVASGLGANLVGSEHGPSFLIRSQSFRQLMQRYSIDLQWTLLLPEIMDNKFLAQKELFQKISKQLHTTVSRGEPFVAIGGDHSMAMGVWQGVISALEPRKLGLIWIDAHLDMHTMQTSVSCNLHGMPLAALLGHGDELLQDVYGDGPVLDPANVALIGARSCEPEEMDLAQSIALASFDMRAIRKSGSLIKILEKALWLVTGYSDRFGISIDLDVLDPRDAPGVNTPEKGGIRWQELQQALSVICSDRRLVGIEIAEFNPSLDCEDKTQHVIAGLIGAIYGDTSRENRSLGSSKDGSIDSSCPMLNSCASS